MDCIFSPESNASFTINCFWVWWRSILVEFGKKVVVVSWVSHLLCWRKDLWFACSSFLFDILPYWSVTLIYSDTYLLVTARFGQFEYGDQWPRVQTGDDDSDDDCDDDSDDVRSSDDSPKPCVLRRYFVSFVSIRDTAFCAYFSFRSFRFVSRPLRSAHIFRFVRFVCRPSAVRSAQILLPLQRGQSSHGQFQWPVTVNAYLFFIFHRTNERRRSQHSDTVPAVLSWWQRPTCRTYGQRESYRGT